LSPRRFFGGSGRCNVIVGNAGFLTGVVEVTAAGGGGGVEALVLGVLSPPLLLNAGDEAAIAGC